MPPAPCTIGSTMIAASSSECRATSSRTPLAQRSSSGCLEAVRRALGEHVLGEHAGEQAVHAVDRVAHGHRSERVAVIAAAHRQQARARGASDRALVLQAQLDRDLDRDRPRVGEEDASRRSGVSSSRRSASRTRRLVRQPAEHHVRHAPELLARRRVERRRDGSRGSRTTTTPSRRSARARRPAAAARPRPRRPAAAPSPPAARRTDATRARDRTRAGRPSRSGQSS